MGWLFGKVAGAILPKLGFGKLFGYLNARGQRQTDFDTVGVESLNKSWKDEVTQGTFYLPVWMVLLGAVMAAFGCEEKGARFAAEGKNMIVFLTDTLNPESLYGIILMLIVLVSLGLSRLALKLFGITGGIRAKAPKPRGETDPPAKQDYSNFLIRKD